MPKERSDLWAAEFAGGVRGIPVQQTGPVQVPILDVAALQATPYQVLASERVTAGFAVIPFRAVLHKPAGDAYTVPNGTELKLRWKDTTTQLFHLEVDPLVLGASKGLDQVGEFTLAASGPSFDWTGASQALIVINPDVDAEGKGIELYNDHATTEITDVGSTPLFLWIWYTTLPVRQSVR